MATESIDIIVRERGARVVKRRMEDIGRSASGAARGIHTLQNAIFVLGAAGTIASLTRMLDSLTNFENRLRLVTDSTQELNDVQAALFDISERTRSGFEATAEIYARTALSVRELGISQQETLAFTESLNKAVILSGANVREANAAIIQLAQGLASDRLSGDELRSVLEQLPFVADVIAESLGVTRGELRQMGRDGKITAEVILRAFREARTEIDDKFGETVATIGQAFNILRTNLLQSLDAFDDASRFSETLANAIIGLANSLDILLPLITAVGVAFAARFAGRYIQSITAAIAAEVKYQRAVSNGSAIVLGSVQADQAKASAQLAKATATSNLANAKVRELQLGVQELTQNAALLRQQQASIVIDNQRRIAKDALTGRFISYNAAVEMNIRTNRALNLTEQTLLRTKGQLTTALGAQTTVTNALTGATARSTAATAAASTMGQRLIKVIPGLGLVASALRGIIALLGGPVSAAFIAIFILMSTFKTKAQEIEEANRGIEETVYKLQDAYDSVGRSIKDVTAELAGLTEIEVLRQLEDQTDLVTRAQRSLATQTFDVAARFVALGDNGRFVLQYLQDYRRQIIDGSIDTEEFRRVLNTLAQGSGSVFEELLVGLIESSRELDTAREGADRLDAVLAVLNGTASASQRELLGLGSSADSAAGSVRNLGNAAIGAINVLRTLTGFIPELARAQQVADNLAEAQNVYRIGVGQLEQRLANGGSIDQYIAGLQRLEETYARAQVEIDGTAQAQREANTAFEEYSAESSLLSLDDRARALELERRRFDELVASLEGGEDATNRIAAATEQYNQRLVQINQQFDQLANGGGSGTGGGSGAASTLEEINLVMEAKKETIEALIGPLQQYTTMMQALNELLAEGAINQDQFAQSARMARITFLESQTTMQAGFERGFLKILDQTADAATQMEGILTRVFDGMSSAIADLVIDGEADFGSLVRSINKMIVQLVVSQAFQQLFGGNKVDGNGLFSSFSGFLGGIVDSIFGVGAGAPGAARGGSFTVGHGDGFGGLTGHDNRLVPLRLKDGEHVDITPRGQQLGGNGNAAPTVIFNVSTPDAESFKASQTQIAARAARMITAGQRNM